MTHKQTIFLSLLALTSPLFAEPELTGTPSQLTDYLSGIPDVVAISGAAEKKVPADKAVIHIAVTTENKSMDAAIEENRILRTGITTELLAAGLPPEAIKAAQFSSTPESGFFSDKIKSYKVENTMKISATNEAQFRAVAALIDSGDEISYRQTEFELADRKARERELLAEACRNAAAKKAIYETELAVSLKPVWFNEGRVMLHQPRVRSRAGANKFNSLAGAAEADFAAPTPPAQFDEIQLNATITIHYRLEIQ